MRFLGNRQKTQDLNAASVSFERDKGTKLQEFFYLALLAPPLDEAASVILMFTVVWQYSAGAVIRGIRREEQLRRTQSLKDEVLQIRKDYLTENRRLRALHKAERSAQTPLRMPAKTDAPKSRESAKHLLTQAALEAARDTFAAEDPATGKNQDLDQLLRGAAKDLQESGLDQIAQDQLFGKDLASLSESGKKTVLILIEDNLQLKDVSIDGTTIALSKRGALAAAAIRKIAMTEDPSVIEDADYVTREMTTGKAFKMETALEIDAAMAELASLDLSGMKSEMAFTTPSHDDGLGISR